jgi:hypothetical protein
MLTLKNYSKFKSKCAYKNKSASYIICTREKQLKCMRIQNRGRSPNSYYLGLAGSPLCSPSQSSWSSRSTRSEGVAPPPSGPQVGSVHKPTQLIWAACLPYWHGWWYWHAMTKTCQNVGVLGEMSAPYAECRRPPTFWPFLQGKVKS